jgi:hypothetical protein
MASTTAAPGRFTGQLVFVCTPEQADGVHRDAQNAGISKAALLREYVTTGEQVAAISREYGVDAVELVNAARLHALRATARDGVELGATR